MAFLDDSAPHRRGIVLKAALIGAYAGTVIELAALIVIDWKSYVWPWTDIWSIPLIVLMYGTFAVPFTALGLCVFGLPLGRALRPLLRYRWSILIAAILGALAGQVFFWLFMGLMWGPLTLPSVSDALFGISWGLPTGLAYWYFERRARSTSCE